MKDSHLYERLSNLQGFKSLFHIIRNGDENLATEVYENVTLEANDHPKYNAIKAAYEHRFGTND